jgi:hypothetical protein
MGDRFRVVTDEYGRWAPCFRPNGGNASLTVGASSERVALPDGENSLLRLTATADMWLLFGASDVVAAAGDILFLLGTEHFIVPAGATHIAAITADASSGKTLGLTVLK